MDVNLNVLLTYEDLNMSCFGENWGLEFSREEIDQALAEGKILSLELELTHACNLRCIYCYAESGRALEDELSFSEIIDAVDQAISLGARKIIVLGGGEPLVYPRLFEVIDHILESGATADLFTNGTLIDKEVAEKFYQKKIPIVIKQNSKIPEVQDFLAGKANSYTAIQRGLKNLLAVGYPDEDHRLGIQTIVCKQNYNELPDLWRWARNSGMVPYVETMTMQGRARKNLDLEVSTEKIKDLFETLAKIDENEFGKQWSPRPPLAASQCARHEYSCTVTANGDINPCPGVNIPVGNIRNNSLKEILRNSKVIQNLRNIRQTIKGQCKECEFLSNCYGCRGHAYQISGDYLAEDSICWINQSSQLGK